MNSTSIKRNLDSALWNRLTHMHNNIRKLLKYYSFYLICQIAIIAICFYLSSKNQNLDVQQGEINDNNTPSKNESFLIRILMNVAMILLSAFLYKKLGFNLKDIKNSIPPFIVRYRFLRESIIFIIFTAFSLGQIRLQQNQEIAYLEVLICLYTHQFFQQERPIFSYFLGLLLSIAMIIKVINEGGSASTLITLIFLQFTILFIIFYPDKQNEYCICSTQYQFQQIDTSNNCRYNNKLDILQNKGIMEEKEKQYQSLSSFIRINKGLCCKNCGKLFQCISNNMLQIEEDIIQILEENKNINFLINNLNQGYCIVDKKQQKVVLANSSMINRSGSIDIEALYRYIIDLKVKIGHIPSFSEIEQLNAKKQFSSSTNPSRQGGQPYGLRNNNRTYSSFMDKFNLSKKTTNATPNSFNKMNSNNLNQKYMNMAYLLQQQQQQSHIDQRDTDDNTSNNNFNQQNNFYILNSLNDDEQLQNTLQGKRLTTESKKSGKLEQIKGQRNSLSPNQFQYIQTPTQNDSQTQQEFIIPDENYCQQYSQIPSNYHHHILLNQNQNNNHNTHYNSQNQQNNQYLQNEIVNIQNTQEIQYSNGGKNLILNNGQTLVNQDKPIQSSDNVSLNYTNFDTSPIYIPNRFTDKDINFCHNHYYQNSIPFNHRQLCFLRGQKQEQGDQPHLINYQKADELFQSNNGIPKNNDIEEINEQKKVLPLNLYNITEIDSNNMQQFENQTNLSIHYKANQNPQTSLKYLQIADPNEFQQRLAVVSQQLIKNKSQTDTKRKEGEMIQTQSQLYQFKQNLLSEQFNQKQQLNLNNQMQMNSKLMNEFTPKQIAKTNSQFQNQQQKSEYLRQKEQENYSLIEKRDYNGLNQCNPQNTLKNTQNYNNPYASMDNEQINQISIEDIINYPIIEMYTKYSFKLNDCFGEFSSASIIKSDQDLFYFIFDDQDLEQRQQLEQELLKELDNFQTKVLKSISHEFGTPLNCAINLLKISSKNVDSAINTNYILPALSSIRILKFACSDFIDYSKIQFNSFKLDVRPTDLKHLLEKVVEYFQPLVNGQQKEDKERISLQFQSDNELPSSIMNDPQRILQVIFNLLTNALKFTEKGLIQIKACLLNEDEIEIAVYDTGIGIQIDQQINIFERKTIRNKKQETSGLGLQISNSIAQKLSPSGTGLSLISKLGEGSTFSFIVSTNIKYEQLKKSEMLRRKQSYTQKNLINSELTSLAEINQTIIPYSIQQGSNIQFYHQQYPISTQPGQNRKNSENSRKLSNDTSYLSKAQQQTTVYVCQNILDHDGTPQNNSKQNNDNIDNIFQINLAVPKNLPPPSSFVSDSNFYNISCNEQNLNDGNENEKGLPSMSKNILKSKDTLDIYFQNKNKNSNSSNVKSNSSASIEDEKDGVGIEGIAELNQNVDQISKLQFTTKFMTCLDQKNQKNKLKSTSLSLTDYQIKQLENNNNNNDKLFNKQTNKDNLTVSQNNIFEQGDNFSQVQKFEQELLFEQSSVGNNNQYSNDFIASNTSIEFCQNSNSHNSSKTPQNLINQNYTFQNHQNQKQQFQFQNNPNIINNTIQNNNNNNEKNSSYKNEQIKYEPIQIHVLNNDNNKITFQQLNNSLSNQDESSQNKQDQQQLQQQLQQQQQQQYQMVSIQQNDQIFNIIVGERKNGGGILQSKSIIQKKNQSPEIRKKQLTFSSNVENLNTMQIIQSNNTQESPIQDNTNNNMNYIRISPVQDNNNNIMYQTRIYNKQFQPLQLINKPLIQNQSNNHNSEENKSYIVTSQKKINSQRDILLKQICESEGNKGEAFQKIFYQNNKNNFNASNNESNKKYEANTIEDSKNNEFPITLEFGKIPYDTHSMIITNYDTFQDKNDGNGPPIMQINNNKNNNISKNEQYYNNLHHHHHNQNQEISSYYHQNACDTSLVEEIESKEENVKVNLVSLPENMRVVRAQIFSNSGNAVGSNSASFMQASEYSQYQQQLQQQQQQQQINSPSSISSLSKKVSPNYHSPTQSPQSNFLPRYNMDSCNNNMASNFSCQLQSSELQSQSQSPPSNAITSQNKSIDLPYVQQKGNAVIIASNFQNKLKLHTPLSAGFQKKPKHQSQQNILIQAQYSKNSKNIIPHKLYQPFKIYSDRQIKIQDSSQPFNLIPRQNRQQQNGLNEDNLGQQNQGASVLSQQEIQYPRAKCFSLQEQFFAVNSQRIHNDLIQSPQNQTFQRANRRNRTKSEFGVQKNIQEIKDALKVKPCNCADILIADDTQMNRHTLKLMIQSKFPFAIDEATNGLEAVEKVKQMLTSSNHCSTYKMIFMDIDMPKLNGYQATSQINDLLKEHNTFCPIIAHTAFDRNECQDEMNQCNMTDYAGKPISTAAIESLFARYIDVSSIIGEP